MRQPLPTCVFRALALTAALCCAPVSAADGVRERFRQALELAQRGQAARTDDDAELRGYVLYPDLQAARWLAALRKDADAELDRRVEAFVRAHPQLPATPELRRAWLSSLAARGLWRAFLAHDDAGDTDPALTCQRYQARIETGDDPAALLRELRAFWQDAPQMPQTCVPPFAWLQAQGALTAAVVERRTRKALADGNLELADWLLKLMPAAQAAPLRQWARLLRNPDAELAVIASAPSTPFEWDALRSGYRKLAARDPERAAQRLQQLGRSRFSDEQYAELQRLTALGLAWDRRPEALDWFRRLPQTAVDAEVHEWRVRAALWSGDAEQASAWLHELPAATGAEPRWTYWRARSLERLGRRQQSEQLYKTLAQDNGYHSLLAAWRLQQPYQPRARTFIDDADAQARLLQRIGILRARELFLTGCDAWAGVEWSRATRDLDPALRLQAARLASRWGWHEKAVRILAEADALDVLELSYPDEYLGPIRATAEQTGVPAPWVYGLMRQESLFNPRAVSASNAYGLLQLLLPTAREVARRRGLSAPSADDLKTPAINIPLGAGYLGELRDRFDGQFVPAVAAYNAGPNAVQRWLPQQPIDADVWIENVPYKETRGYVQKVLWHVTAHEWRSTGAVPDTAALLQPVRTP
ncbi:transglycosylase SLT domain-containing protein [Fontimonas sp. SYSU GA230001]|uniref:lytic transglycosylase domain-containing protein n=1 Tax=Fontimonas sp. SYSU GA230001 TaxID=3142450 RepID=UPI0032B54E47